LTSHLAFLRTAFAANGGADAVVWQDEVVSYANLDALLGERRSHLDAAGVGAGSVVAVEGDFSPVAIAAWLALVDLGCIVVPLTSSVAARREQFLDIAECEWTVEIGRDDTIAVRPTGTSASHDLYRALGESTRPGLVLFSSGSTGEPKAAVHDLVPLLEKFRTPRRPWRTVPFLLYDHIGGVNTMLHTLSNGGCLVTVAERTPGAVLDAVERHRVELLPTSPTFLNLLLLSGELETRDTSSLQLVTYGTEPMPQATLDAVRVALPHVALQQTYGLSELGIMRSKSRDDASLWVRIGGEGFEIRVVDGVLHIRAASAMQGYLNAPSPFTDDGWFVTGDEVEVDGEWLRILGRRSELINVGGEKVYPAEVESAVLEVDNVAEATAFGMENPITGRMVCVRVRLRDPEPRADLTRRIRLHCRQKLAPYKVPVKVFVDDEAQHGSRFKKLRAEVAAGVPHG